MRSIIFFGPSSLENEEVIRRLDRTLADFLKFIDTTIGLNHTLIVFAADHGMADMPEYMTELGYEAGRLNPDEIIEVANKAGQQLGIDGIVRYFYRPYIYLNDEKIMASKLPPLQVEQVIVNALTNFDGINLAISARSLSTQEGNPLLKQVRNNQHVTRSGDIYVIQDPYWFLFDEGPIPSMHGSPWRYDTHVPVIFVGPGINAETVHRRVHPVDVVPTLAIFMGMTPPASSPGKPLKEVLR